ncbi:MAG TPA: ABC transporter ATP-binding protein [Chitinivibrionales bacterium]|nr:ABC transporter ATP-binding protein [Chitinivibrionales bacterium]
MPNCLSCKNLHVSFYTDDGIGRAVCGLSFDVGEKKTLGIVGESGCGKSVTALSVMRLVPAPPGRIEKGEMEFGGRDILRLSENEMRGLRGNKISMIFQDPMTSLNPVFTCGYQIREAIVFHKNMGAKAADGLVKEMLDKVGIPRPAEAAASYPHQLSGGMRQRVMIAMALSCGPQLLIADEPTTALDVTVQARILDLLLSLQQTLAMSMIMITHDLGVVAEIAHDVLVMYAGEAMEYTGAAALFERPLHPYTKGLLATLPLLDKKQNRLRVIPGEVPSPLSIPGGCPFHPRCEFRMDRCSREHPELYRPEPGHQVRCFLYA